MTKPPAIRVVVDPVNAEEEFPLLAVVVPLALMFVILMMVGVVRRQHQFRDVWDEKMSYMELQTMTAVRNFWDRSLVVAGGVLDSEIPRVPCGQCHILHHDFDECVVDMDQVLDLTPWPWQEFTESEIHEQMSRKDVVAMLTAYGLTDGFFLVHHAMEKSLRKGREFNLPLTMWAVNLQVLNHAYGLLTSSVIFFRHT